MNFTEIEIPYSVIQFFKNEVKRSSTYDTLNNLLQEICGICYFFEDDTEVEALQGAIYLETNTLQEDARREYGDYQTNARLADHIIRKVNSKNTEIKLVLEPTCGKGAFILATLRQLKGVERIVGIEIHEPYLWITKLSILDYFLQEGQNSVPPKIELVNANIFAYPLQSLNKIAESAGVLIIGNPPWVTNSELSTLDSANVPTKVNFKNHNGIEAITGKGNFDLGEYITLQLLQAFQSCSGFIYFLVKNSVIKNILFNQKNNRFSIAELQRLSINAKKEFGVTVSASLFVAKLNSKPAFQCIKMNFYDDSVADTFGWYNSYFVSSIEKYKDAHFVEGSSSFTWRSGIKHDCSKVMELIKIGDEQYQNKLGEIFSIEEDLVYDLLKSSDLKTDVAKQARRKTIVTQRKVGQPTDYIKRQYPYTYEYLSAHADKFTNRKSSIYKNKPPFSIFGVGAYSFRKFKVAISGLYKSTHFTFVQPTQNKSVMLDDTCYFLGFEKECDAKFTQFLLNGDAVQQFLQAIIFYDSKRPITKEVLMRIDLLRIYDNTSWDTVERQLKGSTYKQWEQYGTKLRTKSTSQLSIF